MRDDAVDLFMLQVDRSGGGFTVNLARSPLDPGRDPASMRLINVRFKTQARVTRDPSGTEDLWFRYDATNGSPEAPQEKALGELSASIRHADLRLRTGRRQPYIVG